MASVEEKKFKVTVRYEEREVERRTERASKCPSRTYHIQKVGDTLQVEFPQTLATGEFAGFISIDWINPPKGTRPDFAVNEVSVYYAIILEDGTSRDGAIKDGKCVVTYDVCCIPFRREFKEL